MIQLTSLEDISTLNINELVGSGESGIDLKPFKDEIDIGVE